MNDTKTKVLKILEKIMDRHIRDMLESDAPLHRNQFAYQPGKSTETALYQLVTRIEKTLDTKGIALGAFLDIEGTFDNTSYLSIIRSAQRKGINDTLCRWIDATLNGGKMMTTLFEETVEVLVGGGCPLGGGGAVPPPVESGHRRTHRKPQQRRLLYPRLCI
jgi:hypothetical protein